MMPKKAEILTTPILIVDDAAHALKSIEYNASSIESEAEKTILNIFSASKQQDAGPLFPGPGTLSRFIDLSRKLDPILISPGDFSSSGTFFRLSHVLVSSYFLYGIKLSLQGFNSSHRAGFVLTYYN